MCDNCIKCLGNGFVFDDVDHTNATMKVVKCDECNTFDNDKEAKEYAIEEGYAIPSSIYEGRVLL